MKPYYEHGGITIYHGDARDLCKHIKQPDSVITDPVWPNSAFPDVTDPQQAAACKEIGIPYIGIERNEQFCEIATKRLGQEVMDFTEATA